MLEGALGLTPKARGAVAGGAEAGGWELGVPGTALITSS